MFDRFTKKEKDLDAQKAAKIKAQPFITKFATYCRTHAFDTEFLGKAYYEAYQSSENVADWHINLVVEEIRDGEEVLQFHPLDKNTPLPFPEAMTKLAEFENEHLEKNTPIYEETPEALHFVYVYESEGALTDTDKMPAFPYNERTFNQSRTFSKTNIARTSQRYTAAQEANKDVNPLPNFFTEVFNKDSRKGNFQESLKALKQINLLDNLFDKIQDAGNWPSNYSYRYHSHRHSFDNKKAYETFLNGTLPLKNISGESLFDLIEQYRFSTNGTDCYRIQINSMYNTIDRIKNKKSDLYKNLERTVTLIAIEQLTRLCHKIHKEMRNSSQISQNDLDSLESLNDDIKTLLKDRLKIKNIDAAYQRISDHITKGFGDQKSLAEKSYREYKKWRAMLMNNKNQDIGTTPKMNNRF